MAQRWVLSIDFGTSFTAASTREPGQSPRLLEISAPFGPQVRMPSLVLAHESGELIVGWPAESQAHLTPERVERTPKRRLGEAEPLLLGDRAVEVEDAVAAVLGEVLAEARRQHGQTDPGEVHLTHPARWARRRFDALREAAARAGIRDPLLLSEPAAAAIHFSERLAPGDLVAVYDLGGGTFDTAVLRRTDIGEFEQVGPPGGKDGLGGEAFDEALIGFVESELGTRSPTDAEKLEQVRRLRAQFHRDVRTAKEALSQASAVDVPLPPGLELESVRVTRDDFERLIGTDVKESVEILARTLADAGIRQDQLSGVFLAGGSTRIPLVPRLVEERLGRFDTYDEPKGVVALGASKYELAPVQVEHDVPRRERWKSQAPKPPEPLPRRRGAQQPASPAAKRTWLLAAGGAAVAVLVALAAFLALGGDDSGGPFPTTKADQRLAEVLPGLPSNCVKTSKQSGALAAASCDASTSVDGRYLLYQTPEAMDAAFDDELEGGERASAAHCPDRSDRVWDFWPTFQQIPNGKWACYVVDGRARLSWTDTSKVLTVVSDADGGSDFGPLVDYFDEVTQAFG